MSINSNLSFSTAHLGLGHMKQHPPPLDIEVFPSQLSHNLSSISPSVFFLCSHYKKKVPEALYCFLFFIFKSCFFLYGWPISYKMLCISTFVPKSFKLLIGPYFFFPTENKRQCFFSCCLYKVNIFFLYEPSVFIFHANCAWLLNLDVADWSFYVRNLLRQALCLLTAMCLVWFYVYLCIR